jgi:ribose/xylose/arabinose/galactoside ABC-type transport system permease subunit
MRVANRWWLSLVHSIGLELDAITGVVIEGTLLTGGVGFIPEH